MGTCFFWIKKPISHSMDIQVHIGKRSAAGRYCWDCGSVFHTHTMEIHSGRDSGDLGSCPGCGKPAKINSFAKSSAGVELGFVKSKEVPKKGIGSCCSFTWTLMKHKRRLQELADKGDTKKVVVNEYGDKFTASEFLEEELNLVTIEFQSPQEFS